METLRQFTNITTENEWSAIAFCIGYLSMFAFIQIRHYKQVKHIREMKKRLLKMVDDLAEEVKKKNGWVD